MKFASNINVSPTRLQTVIEDLLDMNPQALSRGREYLMAVIKHELIHYMLAQANNPTHDLNVLEKNSASKKNT